MSDKFEVMVRVRVRLSLGLGLKICVIFWIEYRCRLSVRVRDWVDIRVGFELRLWSGMRIGLKLGLGLGLGFGLID